MRISFTSIALGSAVIAGLSGSSLFAQEQPAACAPPPAATTQAAPSAPFLNSCRALGQKIASCGQSIGLPVLPVIGKLEKDFYSATCASPEP